MAAIARVEEIGGINSVFPDARLKARNGFVHTETGITFIASVCHFYTHHIGAVFEDWIIQYIGLGTVDDDVIDRPGVFEASRLTVVEADVRIH